MYKRLHLLIFIVFGIYTGITAQDSTHVKPLVFLMKLDADIDARTNRYTELALEEARVQEADYVIIEMDTYGGALNDADDIRTRVLEFEKPIYVYINKDAASAGALISIACDSIYMAKGASIGAATVVTQDGAAAPDKYQSYMRSIMRSTAEANGRDPKIAEAMVDQDVEVDSISTEGKVITFSTSEAIKHGFCEAQVDGIEDIMFRSGIEDYDTYDYELSASDKIIDIFINPFVSGILILIILGGIYFELQTPGVGFPILASLIAIVLYFTPYYLNGLAENWEIIIFFLGVVLLALEIFVIPGFGVAGVSGITMMVTSLILVMLNNDYFDFSFVPTGNLTTAVLVTFLGLIGSFIVMFIGGVRLTESGLFKRIALETTLDKSAGYTSNFKKDSLMGKTGVAYTILRPSGKVEIENEIYDAYTRGSYIEQGAKIEVIGEEGTSLKVKELS
ncbi:membrane-bound serine protease (ClpP class) [Reichenbachiella faecimaris]|uniref:Membrane-bound serine protease (ClpP class) n=1 Tax=Reichenbachiella faecimaris TaxID=692418 RepID=A0A1W2GQX1_REIFA|nr:NfeD family protein [Reichenbachiella faecimaris]SMD38812.1 membrane-bound serine protease (ClpP class) [Reichenbachiella faecimaris]